MSRTLAAHEGSAATGNQCWRGRAREACRHALHPSWLCEACSAGGSPGEEVRDWDFGRKGLRLGGQLAILAAVWVRFFWHILGRSLPSLELAILGRDRPLGFGMETGEYLRKMRDDWDQRARQNARHFIADGREKWTDADFYASGEQTVAEDILTDMTNICRGLNPRQMRVLELGCGAGRVTRALAKLFGEVHAVDVSPEMVRLAQSAVSDLPNAIIHSTDGATLTALGELSFDFAYSCCVFHHISSYGIIESLVREVGCRLHRGALFKFEVQGCTEVRSSMGETWVGVPFSLEQAQRMAERCGFELRYSVGAGQERFWLWYFRR